MEFKGNEMKSAQLSATVPLPICHECTAFVQNSTQRVTFGPKVTPKEILAILKDRAAVSISRECDRFYYSFSITLTCMSYWTTETCKENDGECIKLSTLDQILYTLNT